MARDPRTLYGERGLVEITSRTTQGRFLLPPSPVVNAIILGVLGRAQELYGVWLHAFIFLSNHFHLLMSVLSSEQMSDFVRYFKCNVSKELGRLHGWEGGIWGGRYHHAEIASEQDEIDQLFYFFANGCKENLVASPLEWTGVSTAKALYNGEYTMEGGIWVNRTAQYRAGSNAPDEEFSTNQTVYLTPMPFLAERSPEEQQQFVRDAIRHIEQETAERHQLDGTSPLGVRAILRQSPYAKPKQFESTPAPRFHAADPEDYWTLMEARKAKLSAYRDAAARLAKGETDVSFPEGCFPPRLPYVESRAPT